MQIDALGGASLLSGQKPKEKTEKDGVFSALLIQPVSEISDEPEVSTAKREFLDYMSKTPEEKMRYSILASMGMTEESLAALPADEQDRIEAKIKEQIETSIKREASEQMAQGTQTAMAVQSSPLTADLPKSMAAYTEDLVAEAPPQKRRALFG